MAEAGRSVGRRPAPHPARSSARAVRQAKRGADPTDPTDDPQIYDVWSRTSAKYRVLAVVLLLINALLFGGLCTFAFWLRTGKVFAPSYRNYWQMLAETFHPSRDTAVSLSTLLTFPINIEEVPLQIVILGLLLAALVSIPILVAILYRLPASLPFLGLVAFVAMMPWLAITLTGACLIVSLKPLRFQFRYASALMGLLLVLAYFYGAARTVSQPVASLANPADRIKYIAPWLLATVGSCLLMGFVLLIARMVNYRPGAITPLLALMFVLPVALFEAYVGRDELHYRIIEHNYGPGSAYFADRDVSQIFDRAVREAYLARPAPRPDIAQVTESAELLWSLELNEALGPFSTAVGQHRYNAVQEIGGFLRHYPSSRYGASALYLMARAVDMRVDQRAFRHERMLRFRSDFPADRSRHWWEMVVTNGPDTPMAAVALYRLAQLDVRMTDVDSAKHHLEHLVTTFSRLETSQDEQAGSQIGTVLQRKPVEATLGIPLDRFLLEGRRLLDLLKNNRDPLYDYKPLVEFAHLSPNSVHYRRNLRSLTDRYPSAQLTDNLELEIALATSDLDERKTLLVALTQRHPHGDAVAETFYRLAQTYQEKQDTVRARDFYNRVILDHPDSIWHQPASARLDVLPATPSPPISNPAGAQE